MCPSRHARRKDRHLRSTSTPTGMYTRPSPSAQGYDVHRAGYEATVARFDRWSGTYDRGRVQSVVFEPVHRALLDRALLRYPAPRRVLDVGCGTGRLLHAVGARLPGRVLVGIDASAGMLAVAAATAAATDAGPGYLRGRAGRLPFRDRSFDLVLCTFSYRHWADQEAGTREVGRVLDRGGVLGIADAFPPPAAPGRWARRRWPGMRPAFWRRRDPREAEHLPVLRAALARSGLTVLGSERIACSGLLGEVTLLLARR